MSLLTQKELGKKEKPVHGTSHFITISNHLDQEHESPKLQQTDITLLNVQSYYLSINVQHRVEGIRSIPWSCAQLIKVLQDKKNACVPQRYCIEGF
jgi:hypothetical protein